MAENKILTEKVRLSYAHLFHPQAPEGGGEAKYSVCLLIPKTDAVTLGRVRAAIETAKAQGIEKWGGKVPTGLKLPLRDGDIERPDSPEFAGMLFMNCNSKNAPLVVNQQKQDIIDSSEVYSGCYAKASVSFYPFNVNGNRGVGCGLNGIQKISDGEPLGGGRETADEMFGEDEEDPLG